MITLTLDKLAPIKAGPHKDFDPSGTWVANTRTDCQSQGPHPPERVSKGCAGLYNVTGWDNAC
jgi:hypothetical protein